MYRFAAILIVLFSVSCRSSSKVASQEKYYNAETHQINGNWETTFIRDAPKSMEELFSSTKPNITFNCVDSVMNGNAGCNSFSGKFYIKSNLLKISPGIAVTKMMCPDIAGEDLFLKSLQSVNGFSIGDGGNTLNLISGDLLLMKLSRKK